MGRDDFAMSKAEQRQADYNRFLACRQWIIDNYGISATQNREQFKKLCTEWIRSNPEPKKA
jgi:hypothetical protein